MQTTTPSATYTTTTDHPKHIGLIVFPGFQALDVFGALDPLNTLAANADFKIPLRLSVIGPSLQPVSTRIPDSVRPTPWANFSESIVPTHTFDNPPDDLDVLIVPGGLGAFVDEELQKPQIELVRRYYPKLKYIISVCTGATVLARAGILDGKHATSNKAAWDFVKSTGPKVNWIAQARWVVDGNIWTTSGVAAGIDGIFAWIKHVWGEDVSLHIANVIEYERHTDQAWDPFAGIWHATSAASLSDTIAPNGKA